MKKLLTFFLLCASALFFGEAEAQTIPHVTGTFLTPGGKTPSEAGLKQIATINGTAVFGTLDFQPYDGFGNRPSSILCGGITYIPQKVRGWIRGDGQLVDNDTAALGIDLLPEIGCTPSNLVMRVFVRLAPSANGRIDSVTWLEDKQLPQLANVDWGSLSLVKGTQAGYIGYSSVQDEGTSLAQEKFLDFAGDAVSCADDAANTRTVCTVAGTGGGGSGGSQHEVNGVDLLQNDPVSFRDNLVVTWTNPSLGNIEANIAAGAIANSMLAGSIDPAKVAGTAEVTTHRGQANGYAPLDGTSKLPLANLPAHIHAETDVTNLVSDLAGKAALSHTHAASDVISGVLAYARGGFGAIGTAADQTFITTSSSAGGFSAVPNCSNGVTDKVLYSTSTHSFSCGSDQTGGAGTGITSLDGLTGTTQTFSKTNDTNVTLTLTPAGADHNFALGWTGTLAKGRTLGTTVYTDQANAYSTGLQDFSAASLKLPVGASPTPTADGAVSADSVTHTYKAGANGATKTLAYTDSNITGNAATATALAADGTNCLSQNFAKGVDQSGNAQCQQPAFSDLAGTIALANTALTTRGDLLTVGAGPALARLGIGAANRFPMSNGTDLVYSQVDLSTSAVTNVLGIANGGTSGATQQAAIDALSGLNTTGDILIYNGTHVVRLARGTNGQCFTSSSTTALWGSCAAGAVGGSGTTNRLSQFTASSTIGDSPFGIATNELQPATDAVSDLGDATHQFRDLYLSGTIHMSGTGPAAIEGLTGTCTVAGTSNGKLCFDSTANRPVYSYNGGANTNLILGTDNLSALSSSTSAQLAGALSDETGTGAAVFGTSPTIVTPTIASFANATHNHTNAAGGGQLTDAALSAAVGVTKGGSGLTAVAADQLFVGTAANVFTAKTLADCDDTTGNHVNYDTTTHAFSCGTSIPAGLALTANPLSQFAATTSAQLAGVLSDETGTGAAVFGTSPTIVTPTIASFANATHNHTNAAGGGQLTDAALSAAVGVTKGGSGLTAVAADQLFVGTAANTFTAKSVPDCDDSAGNHLNYDTTTHAFSCGTTSSGGGGGVSSFTGDSSLLSNSASTGVVTATLANAAAHSYWGNNTGSSAAPGYHQPSFADLTSSASCAQLPALTGDATSSAGSCATTVAKINGTAFSGSNGNLVSFGAANVPADSSIAAANVVTAASNAGAAKQVWVSGGANKSAAAIDFPQPVYAPAADCVNAIAGSGWSTGATPAALCRAGTNNNDGLLSPWGASDVGYFKVHLPNDWDSSASLDISIDLTSTDATSGHTVIMQAATACAKGDGSTTDDVAYNTAQSFGTITLNGSANRTWNATLAGLTKTGCIAGSTLWVKVSRTTDTATNVGVYGATVDVARLIAVQAN